MVTVSEPTKPDEFPGIASQPRSPARGAARKAVWVLGIPCVLLLALYVVLLVTPIRLPFTGPAIRSLVQSFIPDTAQLQMGDMALALENGIWPVIRFSPVEYSDAKTGARIAMEALEVGFSPARALFGQPGTTVTVVAPHIQIVQDLYGPRVTTFELEQDDEGGASTLRVLEGEDAFPLVDISDSGIAFDPDRAGALRSDNDWLVYNLEATEASMAGLVEQSDLGRFSRLVVRDARIDMADPVYGLLRSFEDVRLEIGPVAGQKRTHGEFSALIGGREVFGSLERSIDADGTRRLQADVTNLDFSAFLPFIDDKDSVAALRGSGAISIDVTFTPEDGDLVGGAFKIDLTGIDLRLAGDYFPVASSILDVTWDPAKGQFELAEGSIRIGRSSARIAGVFALGLDASFGPTIGIALKAREVSIHPDDMAAPDEPFEMVEFSGWSAPLYGALGIDRFVARKGEAVVEVAGRIDMLRRGLGLGLEIAGEGVSADDFKRLWPYLIATESRDWFVANVTSGRVKTARMRYDFPAGSLSVSGENKPIPDNSMDISVVGEGVAIKPTAQMPPIVIEGETRLRVEDARVSIAGGGGTIATAGGVVDVANPAVVMDNSIPDESIFEISGDLKAAIPALLALVREQQPELISELDLPIDPDSLSGRIDLGLVATIALAAPELGREMRVDYVVNGTVEDFASTSRIEGHSIGAGQLAFSASQEGYQLGGAARIDGIDAELSVEGTPDSDPVFRIGAIVSAEDLTAFGFDASGLLGGQVRFLAQPLSGGAMQISADLEGADLTISDLGISKPMGQPGTLSAIMRSDGDTTHLENIALGFGTVRLNGRLDYHATRGLIGAEFSTFAVSEGDSASVALTPINGGYAVRIRGEQLDLRPMLGRFFGLQQGSGGVEATQIDAAIELDIVLGRALGFYATSAFNLNLYMLLRDGELNRVTLAAQFGEGNAVSIATNATPGGRALSMAFNDAGTILRLLGVYSQLAGGSGSLVMTTDRARNVEVGQLILRDFAIVDEQNVVQVLGNHSDSRAAIAASNRLDFSAAQVDFVRSSDRVEVTNAVLTGNSVGGTMRGFIYTDRRQYDLTGTYVPLFGLNSIFQKIPLFGPILGGRDGEGLVGVTFAVRGPLDQPQFLVNPLSLLAPGMFRELFEFRARELPAAP